MRRAFFFIVVFLSAATSFASIPRNRALDPASPVVNTLTETRLGVSDLLAPFERPHTSELNRALHQAYEHASTTNVSGLGRFLSVDPAMDLKKTMANPQMWNRYAYVVNDPVRNTDPTGRESDPGEWDGPGHSACQCDPLGSALHINDLREAFSGFGSASGKERLFAGIVGIISFLDIAGNFIGPEVGEGKIAVKSVIHDSPALVKLAEESGKSAQASLDHLVGELAKGNVNPGIGTKRVFGNVFEARAKDGARVYFRVREKNTIEILAKSIKANQDRAISLLRKLYL